jgi:hypothetical protein
MARRWLIVASLLLLTGCMDNGQKPDPLPRAKTEAAKPGGDKPADAKPAEKAPPADPDSK